MTEKNPRLEYLDPTPVAAAVNFERPPTMQEMIQMYMRSEMRLARDGEHESFEESIDFDIEDDDLPVSQYEHHYLVEERLAREAREAEDKKRTQSWMDKVRNRWRTRKADKTAQERPAGPAGGEAPGSGVKASQSPE